MEASSIDAEEIIDVSEPNIYPHAGIREQLCHQAFGSSLVDKTCRAASLSLSQLPPQTRFILQDREVR